MIFITEQLSVVFHLPLTKQTLYLCRVKAVKPKYLFFFVIIFLSVSNCCQAGRRPVMKFSWVQKDSIALQAVFLIESDRADFLENDTLMTQMPGYLKISSKGFELKAFAFKKHNRLALQINDTVYVSNIFSPTGFFSRYRIDFSSNRIQVITDWGGSNHNHIVNFLILLLSCIVIEFLLLKSIPGWKIPWLLSIKLTTICNIVTIPVVWFVIPLFISFQHHQILAAIIFSFITEGFILRFVAQPKPLWRYVFIYSFLLNVISLTIGGLIILGFYIS